MKKVLFSIGLGLLLVSQVAQAATYNLDVAHSRVGFAVKHLVIATAKGQFDKYNGTFNFDPSTGKLSDVSITLDAKTINTNEPDRDKHLKGEDFFKTEKHPHITFKSEKVEYSNSKPTKVHGSLTMVGVSKPVILDVDYKGSVKDPWGNEKLVFEAQTTINRKDWGISWNKSLDKGGLAVSDEVKIIIEGQASPKK